MERFTTEITEENTYRSHTRSVSSVISVVHFFFRP